ncbi:hypothetical protein [Flagellimonas sp. MMG031]|uniref:Chemotaxis methyl-accepting receptor HlyB-like 4HB MCP domain-containing protein n=1 Tax=Flagellimonas sp. MMG031 TaxID=3158549 RepID=A0AAU7MVW4_9FLAO
MGKMSKLNLKLIISILFVFVLVLFTNRLDHGYFSKILYDSEQKHLAQYNLNELYRNFSLKKCSLDSSRTSSSTYTNEEIEKLLLNIDAIKLSHLASMEINKIKGHYNTLSNLEASGLRNDEILLNKSELKTLLDQILEKIEGLLETVHDESTSLVPSRHYSGAGKLLLNVELIFMLILGSIIQLIIIWKPNEE